MKKKPSSEIEKAQGPTQIAPEGEFQTVLEGQVIDAARPARNPIVTYLESLAPTSARTMERVLVKALRVLGAPAGTTIFEFPWQKLRYEHVNNLRSKLRDSWSPATANLVLTAVRQVLLHCRRLGLMSAEEQTLATDVKTVKGHRLPRGRMLSPEEIRSLIDGCEDRTIGARDMALLALLAGTGLRRHEAANLQMGDYDRTKQSLRVIGKGNKEREVPVNTSLGRALSEWIAIRGPHPGPILCRVLKGGKITDHGISPQLVFAIIKKISGRIEQMPASENRKPISPHDFRRTFISALLDKGADVFTVAGLVGHENIDTTRRYDMRGEKAKRDVVELLNDDLSKKV